MSDDFVSRYMRFASADYSEAPAAYHRWTCLSIMGAIMGRQCWFQHGPRSVFPNQYILLMGGPGARKGSALGIGKRLLRNAGYTRIAANKTSPERFLTDLQQVDETLSALEIENLSLKEPCEIYVTSGEFVVFIGSGGIDFLNILTDLWDNLPDYKHPKLHGKSVVIHKPTVNIIGAATPTTFALSFPVEAMGTGFLSRTILVHGEETGIDIAFPEELDELQEASLLQQIKEVKKHMHGPIGITKEAKKLAAEIYTRQRKYVVVQDARFLHYERRRFEHLLKIALLLAVFEGETGIDVLQIKRANSMLANTERKMSLALGEYGKNKNSDVANKILEYLSRSEFPQTAGQIFKVVANDLSRHEELSSIINLLINAEKIKPASIAGKQGYTRNIALIEEWPAEYLDDSWLLQIEFS